MTNCFPHRDILIKITISMGNFDSERVNFHDFAAILSSYPQLQVLQVITSTSVQSDMEISSINNLLDSPKPRSYDIRLFGRLGAYKSRGVGYPSVFCPVLTDLIVGSSWHEDWPAEQVDYNAFRRPQLHTLRLESTPKPWSKLEHLVDVSQTLRLSLWLNAYFEAVDDCLKVIQACSASLRTLSIFHASREPFPTDRFEHSFPSMTNLILWIGYYPYPFQTWLIPIIDEISHLAPNLCRLDLYIHFPPPTHWDNKRKADMRGTLDYEDLDLLFQSISSKAKQLQDVRLWFWERGSTSVEDVHHLEEICKRLIYQNGWTGSLGFVWGTIWTEIWPFLDDFTDP
ncbi:hypothetical protein DL96DRAFT_1688470 [Flagelloscypha sp. PMI_526]|nr:hypothetical protein DL96DRAFT_1688470 [Flagelloscypha sp. PMI_526]